MSDAASSSSSRPPPSLPSEDSALAAHLREVREKRVKHLDHALRSLDSLIWLHFLYLYYMDCNTPLLLFPHILLQFYFLAPKPPGFPVPPPRATIIALAGAFVFEALTHIISSAPSAGETEQGYLHGGLLIDFIGEKGPISKWRLVWIDSVILVLQAVMVGVARARQKLRPAVSRNEDDEEEESDDDEEDDEQDIEAEEAGVRRSQGHRREEDDEYDFEVPEGEDAEAWKRGEAERTLEALAAGEFCIAKVDLVKTAICMWKAGNGPTSGEDGDARARTRAAIVAGFRSGEFRGRFGVGRTLGA